MGTIFFKDGEYEVFYNSEDLEKIKNKIIIVNSIINNNEYVPYIVTLIDRLLNNDLEAVREIFSPDISKEYDRIKDTIDNKIMLLRSDKIDINEKLKIVDCIKQLLLVLKNIGSRLGIIMDYYFELSNLIRLKKISQTKELI